MRALLIDQSRDRSTLVAARCLARAGYEVGSAAHERSFVSRSRYVRRHHRVSECGEDEDRFVADVASAVAEGGYEIVFCAYEAGIMALSRRREEIAPAIWPYAEQRVVERAFDKLDLYHAVTAAGLRAPHTEPASEQAIDAWAGPVVVKARQHVPRRFDTGLFDSAAQGRELAREIRRDGGEPLLQEPVHGRMGAVVIVAGRDGEVLCEVHQEALHTWPPGAGDTVRGLVVGIDPQLSRGVRELVRSLGWFGLTQVEFVRDDDGVPRITDFNGRFYGSMALATGAGANLPALWADDALGRERQAPVQARRGARFQWLNRDLAAGAAAGGARGALGALALVPFASHSMWSVRDPMPAVRYLLPEAARRLWGRAAGRGD